MSEDGSNGGNEIDASLGSLDLRVYGEDPEWVSEQFEEKLDRLLSEAGDMSQALREGARGHQ